MRTLDLVLKFANQRPNLDYCNYGDPTAYRREAREITSDLHDFRELLALASRRIDNLDEKLTAYLSATGGRLQLKNNELYYCTGQYFPTEYRPAVNRVLATLIWADFRDEISHTTGTHVYNNGDQIRKAIKWNLSRRAYKNYFN